MKKKKKEIEKEIVEQDDSGVNDQKEKATEEEIKKEEAAVEKEETSEEESRDPVEALKEELERQKDKYIRLMAEFDNYKRRTSKEYERLVESANERLMLDIIDVRESFERALAMTGENEDYVNFLDGMRLIFTKLDENLKKNGLEVFTKVGDEFNPEIHDAMMKTPHDKIPEDHIVEIYEKGYTLKNHVIKHAKVIVSAGEAPEAETKDSSEDKEEISEEAASD
jgi:molecular chaperone GrpE